MNSLDRKNIDPIVEMSRIAQDILNLDSRAFKESYRSAQSGTLIYDSQWCRISLVWGGREPGSGDTMYILYGRLHAPNEDTTMLWNGEECHCWHDLEDILHFLDGRTPSESANLGYSHPLVDSFFEKETSQKYSNQPEWIADMHAAILDHYGQKLFDLFDLREPEAWQRYRQFLKEVYDLAGRKLMFGPSKDKVC